MDFHIVKGDKSMLEKTQTQELSYKSTRETAKILQVSLGTIQKMVETGELIAWKTRGGHRRILDISIEHQLAKRRELLSHFCAKKYSILGIFSGQNDILHFENYCKALESSISCFCFTDISEGLMSAVELKPEIIYIDYKLGSIDQYHSIHQLNKNSTTSKIPLLIHQDILKELDLDNTCVIHSPCIQKQDHWNRIYPYDNTLENIDRIIKKALVERVI
jgi:excisionase family DNA binding protein